MSENDPTKDIGQKYDTRPMLETILGRLDSFKKRMEARFDALDVRLDRMDAVAYETQSKFHALRADFNEFKGELRERFPAVK